MIRESCARTCGIFQYAPCSVDCTIRPRIRQIRIGPRHVEHCLQSRLKPFDSLFQDFVFRSDFHNSNLTGSDPTFRAAVCEASRFALNRAEIIRTAMLLKRGKKIGKSEARRGKEEDV